MKKLLVTSAVIEVGAGAGLLCCPSAVVALLLGSPLDTAAGFTLARVAGAALLALGVACALARHDEQGSGGRSLVAGMAVYNLGAVIVFGMAAAQKQAVGIGLWPALGLHAAMAVWCLASLGRKSAVAQKTSSP